MSRRIASPSPPRPGSDRTVRDARATVLTILRQTAAEHDGRTEEEAVSALLDLGELARQTLAEMGARQMLAEHRAHVRTNLERGARKAMSTFTIDPTAARRAVVRAGYYAWPLPGGGQLGDADVKALREAAAFHQAVAAGERRRARQYERLAESLERSGATIVRHGLTEIEIAQILAEGE